MGRGFIRRLWRGWGLGEEGRAKGMEGAIITNAQLQYVASRKVVEAVGIVGYYTLVAYTLKCFRVKPKKSNLSSFKLT